MKVEFTQHTGNEMYHPHLNGFNKDWRGDEREDRTAASSLRPPAGRG
jgi:hypothetical protein